MRFARAPWAIRFLSIAACSTEDEPGIRIRSFELEKAEPPADSRGGRPLVRPRTDLHFRWEVQGDVTRVELTANDVEVAAFEGETLPDRASDLCDDDRCGTLRMGEVEYKLTAWDIRGNVTSESYPVRVTEQGLQILSFTSNPENVVPGAAVELAWETAGAVETKVEAAPIGGGEARLLGTFGAEQARIGSLVDPGIQLSTLYRLIARSEEGAETQAEIVLPLRGEAWLTELVADPVQVAVEEPFQLQWKSTGLERITILRNDGGATIDDIGREELEEGSRELRIRRDTEFSFLGVSSDGAVLTERCNDGGCVPATVLVRIHPGPAVVSFEADEPEIDIGDDTLLRWEVVQADQVSIAWMENGATHEQQFAPNQVLMPVKPMATTRYTLVATGGGRTASRQLVLGVRPKAKVTGPNDVMPGEVFTLSWTTEGAASVELLVDGERVDVGNAGVAAGTVTVTASRSLSRGGSFEVELRALSAETPQRVGLSTIRIAVE